MYIEQDETNSNTNLYSLSPRKGGEKKGGEEGRREGEREGRGEREKKRETVNIENAPMI